MAVVKPLKSHNRSCLLTLENYRMGKWGKCIQGISEAQLANTSASFGTLHSEVVGDTDGEHFITHPPPQCASP